MPRTKRRTQRPDDDGLSLQFASLAVHDGVPIRRLNASTNTNPSSAAVRPTASRTQASLSVAQRPHGGLTQTRPKEQSGRAVTTESYPLRAESGAPVSWRSANSSPPSQYQARMRLNKLPVEVNQTNLVPIVLTQEDFSQPFDDVSPSSSSSVPPYMFENGATFAAQPSARDRSIRGNDTGFDFKATKKRPFQQREPSSPHELKNNPVEALVPPPPIPGTVAFEQRKIRSQLKAMIFGTPLTSNQSDLVYAIDCEMVGVGPIVGYRFRNGKRAPDYRSALARVSIVDYQGHVVLDTFVNPGEPVKDFRTAVSGVRARDMRNAMSLSDARILVRKILQNHLVVGHALHNDFRVLKHQHDPSLTRDTQTCPEVRQNYGQSIGLKALCVAEFGVNVQPAEHSSVTDARAAMAIYHLYHAQWESDLRRMRSSY